MRRWSALIAIAWAALGWVMEAQEGFKIIVNPANPVSSITRTQASAFFLEKTTWEDGQPVAPVDLPPTSSTRDVFSGEVLGMPVSSVVQRWRGSSGSQSTDAPPVVATDREVLAYVRLKPGAIGYVSAATATPGVKVIPIGSLTSRSPRLVEVGGAIPMPERIVYVPPVYPPVAKMGRLEGNVDVEIVIGTTGNVDSARVIGSVEGFDASALAAVRRWKFRPTVIEGVPVRVKAKVRVAFVL